MKLSSDTDRFDRIAAQAQKSTVSVHSLRGRVEAWTYQDFFRVGDILAQAPGSTTPRLRGEISKAYTELPPDGTWSDRLRAANVMRRLELLSIVETGELLRGLQVALESGFRLTPPDTRYLHRILSTGETGLVPRPDLEVLWDHLTTEVRRMCEGGDRSTFSNKDLVRALDICNAKFANRYQPFELLQTLDKEISRRFETFDDRSRAAIFRGFCDALHLPKHLFAIRGGNPFDKFDVYSSHSQAEALHLLAFFNSDKSELIHSLAGRLRPHSNYEIEDACVLSWSLAVLSDDVGSLARRTWLQTAARAEAAPGEVTEAGLRRLFISGAALGVQIPDSLHAETMRIHLGAPRHPDTSRFQEELAGVVRFLGYPYRMEASLGLYNIDLLVNVDNRIVALEPGSIQFHGNFVNNQVFAFGRDVLRERYLARLGIPMVSITVQEWQTGPKYPNTAEDRELYGTDQELLLLARRAHMVERRLKEAAAGTGPMWSAVYIPGAFD